MSGITKTIPAKAGQKTVDALYDGSLKAYEFHMAGKPSKLVPGDYVYTIFNDQLVGRMKISSIEGGATHPKSGDQGHSSLSRHLARNETNRYQKRDIAAHDITMGRTGNE